MGIQTEFESWKLRHLKKRSEEYALENEVGEDLLQLSNKIEQNDDLNKNQIDRLRTSLHRLAQIKKFSKGCPKGDCEVCKKVEDLRESEPTGFPWKMDLELWRWQKECSEEWWNNGGEGIVKVVTGAGKTILALHLISKMKNLDTYSDNNLKIIVIVPSTALLEQWEQEFKDNLNLSEEHLGVFYGDSKDDIQEKNLMIYVINSASKYLSEHLSKINSDLFLIADECHRYASEEFSKIFENQFDYKIGLSATPEREGDFGFENVLIPNLGEIIYSYTYSDARKDNIIPPYRLKRIGVNLQDTEEALYEEFSEKLEKLSKILLNKYPALKAAKEDEFIKILGQLQKEYDDDALDNYTILTNQRKAIIHESFSKMAALRYIIEKDIPYGSRVLVFHERTDSADKIYEFLREEEYKAGIYHSKMSPSKRKKELERYRKGDLNILVTCKALDEGLDVPNTSIGIIAAATSSIRQRIQRVGRILRKAPGKEFSKIYTIYVKGKEERIFTKKEMHELKKSAQKIEEVSLKF